ncbi:MAG: hypothetical protein HYR66_04750, partial [Sphingobacteriales bacterium]|nr:hypothetical protein [Sphingobacteriales bacterium]
MKIIAAILLLTFININVFSQQGLIDSAKIPLPHFHYLDEYAFDVSTNPNKWLQENKGLNVSFVTTNKAYFRTEVPSLNNKSVLWKTSGWKGERLNTMLLTWSPDTINQIRFILHDLQDKKGNSISKKNINLDLVRYVVSNYPYDANEVTCGDGPLDKAWLIPDRLESFERFDLPGKTVRPVWLSANVPSTTIAGTYTGAIEVITPQQKINLQIELTIQNQILPKPHDWSFRLDLWQNPWVIAEYYKVKPWSEAHKLLLKQHLKLYVDAGGKYITTYAVNSPWADNSYMLEGSMIEWMKKKNGSWQFNYSIFDQYVQLAMEVGIDKAITIYTPIPWGDRFRFIDEATGNYVTQEWNATSTIFKKNWNIFLTDLKKHLEKKGWFNKVYLGINENAMEQTLSAIKVIKEHSKQWKITYAGNWHTELDSLLDDYSCVIPNEPGMGD